MTTSTSSRGLPPGCTFRPTERQLTDLYLHCKITGEALPDVARRSIHIADVYSAEPEKLVEGFDQAPGTKQPVWYFFSPVRYVGGQKTSARGEPGRKARTIGGQAGKNWHSEKREPVQGGSEYGGYKEKFSYMVKNESTGKEKRAGWIMAEYGISPDHGGGDLVLCEIHRSTRTGPKHADPIVRSKKRKAADQAEDPTASARPRHTEDHDEHPLLVETWEGATEQHGRDTMELLDHHQPTHQDGFLHNMYLRNAAAMVGPGGGDLPAPELWDGERVMEEQEMYYGAADFAEHHQPEWYSAASLTYYGAADFAEQNDAVMPVGDLAVPPCQPAAQPEDDEVQVQNYNDDGQMDVSLGDQDVFFLDEKLMAELEMNCPELFNSDQQFGADPAAEEQVGYDHQPTDQAAPPSNYGEGHVYANLGEGQTEPDKTAADEVIAFSPEMVWRCTDNMMMPWRSTPSVTMTTFGLY